MRKVFNKQNLVSRMKYMMFIFGCIILIGIAYATTTITDSSFSSTGNVSTTENTSAQQMTLTNSGGNHALTITQSATTSSSTSAGGAILLTNTANDGAGLIIYSNHAGSAAGRLLNVRVDNILFDQDAVHIDNDGVGDSLSITNSNSNNAASNALSVSYTGIGDAVTITSNVLEQPQGGALTAVCSNMNDSCIDITGNESARGSVKITHKYPGVSDANAAALSLDTQGTGTAAQGLFITSTIGSTGNYITVTNKSSNGKFSVNATGTVRINDLSGTGNRILCITPAGDLYAGNLTGCP